MDHAVVQRWLRQILGPYAEADRVYSDVDRTLLSISSLSPKTEVYTYDDGRTQLLLVLTGTVPIHYKTATYNIPVSIWIPRNYPREPPIVYVTPTSDMLVRKGRYVDPNGRVEGEYIQRWQRKWEACSLLELVHDCQSIFGQEPPVYAKPRSVGGSTSSSTASSSAVHRQASPATAVRSPVVQSTNVNGQSVRERGPAPLPGSHAQAASPSLGDKLPLRPPKPGQTGDDLDRRSSDGSMYASDQRQTFDRTHQRWSSHNPTSSDTHRQQNGLQQRPAFDERYTAEPTSTYGVGLGHAGYSQSQRNASDARSSALLDQRHMSWNGAPQRAPQPSLSPSIAMQPGPLRSASLSSNGSRETGSIAAPPLPPMPSHQNPMLAREFANQQLQPNPPHVPAPPRPPNPELLHVHALLHTKLQQRVQHIQSTSEESNGQLRLLSEDLDRGDLAIKDEMARLEAVRDVCKTTGDELQRSVDMASQRLDELRAKEEPDFDGLLSATSLVGNQLLDLVAEDNAIEDTLYHLGRALNAETLDLDRFLKQTRFLAREQFMRRALAMKICRGMGWDT